MSKPYKILFLYAELAEYFLSCINNLCKNYSVEITIVRWPLNKEAPFHFSFSEKVKIVEKKDFSTAEKLNILLDNLNPDCIYCSGWIDKDYVKACKDYKKSIPKIIGMDNKWTGNFKQKLATLISKVTISKIFTHCWVPGNSQAEYAQKLGFKKNQIRKGFYSADFFYFDSLYQKFNVSKKEKFPHRFIYVGRYVAHKGIENLWKAFIELQTESPNEWELWCLGTGPVKPIEHDKIKHVGFVQPKELEKYISATGVFILPSQFEPWGVVVHEFAAAGFPILSSSEVGSSEVFLSEGQNGFSFDPLNSKSIKDCLKKIIHLSDGKLNEMAEKSNIAARLITPETWSKTLIALIEANVRN